MKWILYIMALLGFGGEPVGGVVPVQVPISVAVTGDVLLARSVNAQMVKVNDFTYPWKNVVERLRKADVTYINLETPLTGDCKVIAEGMTFCGNSRGVEGLTFAGVDVANLANNHVCNFGKIGLEQTKQILSDDQIYWTGTPDGEPIINIKNKKIGFLGFNDVGVSECGINSTQNMEQKIRTMKERADWAVVEFHWGVEYTDKPTKRQVDLAHRAVEAGADLVVGNHPHWVQTSERYKDKLIVYSHGNFIFDQRWSKKTMEGIVGWYEFAGASVSAKFLPVNTNYDLQTRWVD